MLALLPFDPVRFARTLGGHGGAGEPVLDGGTQPCIAPQADDERDVVELDVEALPKLREPAEKRELLRLVPAVAGGAPRGDDEPGRLEVAEHPRRPAGLRGSLADGVGGHFPTNLTTVMSRCPAYALGVRVHIISDMEGVSGIVRGRQTLGGAPMYDEGRELYTEEINAAVRGAKAAGATEIVVMDCHGAGGEWSFNSLVPDLLHPDCEFVVQEDWTEYTAFLEEGCDAALLVGMHAMAGAGRGGMNHTVSGQDYYNLRFNGTLVGETGIHAALCGTWECPVLLVTGDDVACEEGKTLVGGGLTTVAVKKGLGATSARQIPPVRARELIEAGARTALSDLKAVDPWSPGSPCEITVEFKHTLAVDKLRFRPGVERVDDRTISVTAETWWEAWKTFYF